MNTPDRTGRQMRSISGDFRTRDDGGAKTISGYFAVFDQNYELFPGGTESVASTAFDGALGDDIRCLTDHDTTLVLGRCKAGTLSLRVDSHGLWGEVALNEDDSDAMNLYARVKRGDVDQCSFGFDILDEEMECRDDGSVHWTIKSVKLYEVSVVTFPAYTSTSVSARKAEYETARARKLEKTKEDLKARLDKLRA